MERLLRVVLFGLPVGLLAGCAVPDSPPPTLADGPLQVQTIYAPHSFDPSKNPQFYAMTVQATSDADFARRLAAARAAGPGGKLPPGVTVDAWLELEGLDRLRSSLTGSFETFRVEIAGRTVADLGSRLNVVPEAPVHGWATLVVQLPPSLVLPGTPVRVVQRRAGAATDVELSLDF
jgi:hypothetical protein